MLDSLIAPILQKKSYDDLVYAACVKVVSLSLLVTVNYTSDDPRTDASTITDIVDYVDYVWVSLVKNQAIDLFIIVPDRHSMNHRMACNSNNHRQSNPAGRDSY